VVAAELRLRLGGYGQERKCKDLRWADILKSSSKGKRYKAKKALAESVGSELRAECLWEPGQTGARRISVGPEETAPRRVTRATLMRSGGRGSHGVFPPTPTTGRETAMYWVLFGNLSARFDRPE
jgi:hypothetical protein